MPTKFTKASFPRGLERNQILVPHLEAYDKWDQEWDFHYEPKGEDDAWHPSGDCVPSPLALWEAKQQDRRPIGPSLQRTFLVGHFWHQIIQKVVVELGYCVPEDIERTGIRVFDDDAWVMVPGGGLDKIPMPQPYRWVRGQGDMLLTMPRWSGICDIKTMNTTDWHECERTGLLPSRFADKYEAQINIYMDLFDQERGLILGVNKDNSKFIEFQFERNQPLIDAIYEKWEHVGACLLDGTEPTEEYQLEFRGPIN